MKKAPLVFLFLLTTCVNFSASLQYFKYVDPVPNAKFVKKETSIIIKPEESIDKRSLLFPGAVNITGSLSGECGFSLVKSDDDAVIILKPLRHFRLGETITVKFNSTIKNLNGKSIQKFSYTFEIQSREGEQMPLLGLVNELSTDEIKKLSNEHSNMNSSFFPMITVTLSDNPSSGSIFLSNITLNSSISNTPYLLILNNNAQPVFSRQMIYRVYDFNKQPNGNLTYYDQNRLKYFELSPSYSIIDSFYCGNGYSTDLHELRVLNNHHAFLLSYDRQIIDMRPIVPGGDSAALVTGLIIQEIDANKNVVFQWRSWDHFLITDAEHEDLTAHLIDYVHGNALEIENDGTILLSSRHLEEITKINRTTGEIVWRLGGKNNMFNFTNDPIRFSYQHGIRRLANGNIILYDNGNYHIPNFSRAVEYSLNETTHTATLVWEYRNTPVIYGFAMGFAQRLDNGNTLISWGAASPTLTEVRPNGSKALQMTFSPGIFTYRAFKYDWNPVGLSEPTNIPNSFELYQNYPNPFNPSTRIKFSIPRKSFVRIVVYNSLGIEVKILRNEYLSAGNYDVDFNGENLASGVYFYKLQAEDYTSTKKMILIK